ncbi:MAG: stage II sporulation protein M [Akkermansiaceae bacterium]|nr:stage II sporulation protein M [Akkermansiaceae bacterium]
MTLGDFEARNRERWAEYERLLEKLEKGGKVARAADASSLPRRFRELCIDLSLAEFRMYGERMSAKLNELVIRGYEILYRQRRVGLDRVVRFLAVGFPAAVRREWRLFWLCSAVFWLPFFVVMLSAGHDIQWVQSILGADGMAGMDSMYGGREQQIEHLRDQYGANFMMFGHYIHNNVGIDLRTFAGGLAAGVGTLFYLLFNGIYLGAAAGYVNEACDPESFWTFVSGHSSYELLGMVVSGMAGMRLGLALLNPGRLPRVRALTEAAKSALPLIYGAMLLTTLAAVVEAFWSARFLPSGLKYGVGIAGWMLHVAYFLLAGRRVGDAA